MNELLRAKKCFEAAQQWYKLDRDAEGRARKADETVSCLYGEGRSLIRSNPQAAVERCIQILDIIGRTNLETVAYKYFEEVMRLASEAFSNIVATSARNTEQSCSGRFANADRLYRALNEHASSSRWKKDLDSYYPAMQNQLKARKFLCMARKAIEGKKYLEAQETYQKAYDADPKLAEARSEAESIRHIVDAMTIISDARTQADLGRRYQRFTEAITRYPEPVIACEFITEVRNNKTFADYQDVLAAAKQQCKSHRRQCEAECRYLLELKKKRPPPPPPPPPPDKHKPDDRRPSVDPGAGPGPPPPPPPAEVPTRLEIYSELSGVRVTGLSAEYAREGLVLADGLTVLTGHPKGDLDLKFLIPDSNLGAIQRKVNIPEDGYLKLDWDTELIKAFPGQQELWNVVKSDNANPKYFFKPRKWLIPALLGGIGFSLMISGVPLRACAGTSCDYVGARFAEVSMLSVGATMQAAALVYGIHLVISLFRRAMPPGCLDFNDKPLTGTAITCPGTSAPAAGTPTIATF